MTRNARIGLLVAAVAVAAGAFVVVGVGGDEPDPEPAATAPRAPATAPPGRATEPRPERGPVIRLVGGEPAGGVRALDFGASRDVRFTVASDVQQEVHVHGYDITRTVPAGGSTTISFAPRLQGVYEVESHTTGEPIARLLIAP